VAFSPDNRWLATGGDRPRLWRVPDWSAGPELPAIISSQFTFSPDSNVLALGNSDPGVIDLIELHSGVRLIRLTGPTPSRIVPSCFTPDGSKLIVNASDTGRIHWFDLGEIRRGLSELGLDWDAPPLPVRANEDPISSPLEVKVPENLKRVNYRHRRTVKR
jgi:WD40 repeat protein